MSSGLGLRSRAPLRLRNGMRTSFAISKPVTGPPSPWNGRVGVAYQATAARKPDSRAAAWIVSAPPQHHPLTPTRSAFTPGRPRAQFMVARRSPSSASRRWRLTIISSVCVSVIRATPPAREQLGRHRAVARLGEAAGAIANVLVDGPDLRDEDDDRRPCCVRQT